MLIEFKVGNFLSFKDIVTLSMVASSDREHLETNTIPVNDKLRLLKSAVLYGANASGKSNLIKAIDFMRNFILSSSKEISTDKIKKVEEFRLSTETEKTPSSFEITFQLDKIRYRYGFQVDRERVHNEWLYYVPTIREALLFIREKDKIHLGSGFKEGRGLERKTRENALFLSVVDQFNGQTAKQILKWFDDLFVTLNIQEDSMSSLYLKQKEFRDYVLNLLKVADLGLKSIKWVDIGEALRKRAKEGRIYSQASSRQTIHQKYGEDNEPVSDVEFDLSVHESAGTQALFELAGPIYDALKNNLVLFIDELTSKLHPLLIQALIEIFNHYKPGKESKPNSKGQLIFACHDTSILTNQFFRRDQIWFTQKNEYGATELYSLDEYKVRKDALFKKDYIMGKYGAIPFIGDIESLFENSNNGD